MLLEIIPYNQVGLEWVVKNQVGLLAELLKIIANKRSLGFYLLKMAFNLNLSHFFKTHLKNDQKIKLKRLTIKKKTWYFGLFSLQ